jgi:hypothetical protein
VQFFPNHVAPFATPIIPLGIARFLVAEEDLTYQLVRALPLVLSVRMSDLAFTPYPLDIGAYHWAIAKGLFKLRRHHESAPEFIGGF